MLNGWHNLSDEQYNEVEALRSSDLKNLLRSPAHYKASLLETHSSTPAQQLGSLIHLMILQPDEVEGRVHVLPEINLRTNAGKEQLLEFNKSLGTNGYGVTKADFDKANAVRDAVLSHSAASKLLTSGVAEMAGIYNGLKIKPDFRRFDGIIVDLKTTIDGSAKGFAKAVANFNYHVQAAFYLDISSNICNKEYHSFCWIAVEKELPYATSVFVMDEDSLELGRKLYLKALDNFNRATASNVWDAYPSHVQKLKLPNYAFYEGENL